MEITEVRIKLMEDPGDRLKAFCSITFDSSFVIRDLKIIEGTNGAFVAMPSRKLTAHCSRCRVKNHVKANYCNQCGCKMDASYHNRSETGRSKLYADIAHPINSACRELIQKAVLESFETEKERALQPGYTSTYDDYGYDFEDDELQEMHYDQPHKPHAPHLDTKPSEQQSDQQTIAPASDQQFGLGVF